MSFTPEKITDDIIEPVFWHVVAFTTYYENLILYSNERWIIK